jgi:endonuclease/exonuclease/phosphatase (EEP) superfamily protein YafD
VRRWGRWVLAGQALAWGLVLTALAVTGARWLDRASTPLVLMQSLGPVAAPLALVGAAGVLLPGRRGYRTSLAGMCAVVVAVQTAIWIPWLTEDAPASGTTLTVMSVNLLHGRADTNAIGREVRRHGVDVLVLTEVTDTADRNLRADGIYRRLPYTTPRRIGQTTVIRSRLPLGPARGAGGAAMSARNPAATMRYGKAVSLRAVHPAPPTPQRVRQWRATLASLTAWAGRTRGSLIMAGDFNASVDHPAMRQLLARGLRDAHEIAGAGRPPTWPNGRSLPAFVHIDHVLVRGIDVESVQEVLIPGTDHDAVLAELVIPDEQ